MGDMTQFDAQTLAHLKKLCRIDCSPDEESDILNSITKILQAMEELNEVDTEGVKPCSFVLRSLSKNSLREDEVQDLLPREQFLSNCPSSVGGMVRTPPVLK